MWYIFRRMVSQATSLNHREVTAMGDFSKQGGLA